MASKGHLLKCFVNAICALYYMPHHTGNKRGFLANSVLIARSRFNVVSILQLTNPSGALLFTVCNAEVICVVNGPLPCPISCRLRSLVFGMSWICQADPMRRMRPRALTLKKKKSVVLNWLLPCGYECIVLEI